MADTIPTELIERTLSFAATIDTPTCLAVCLTNKLGLGAARLVLYRDISIPGEHGDELVDERMRKWSTLCRTLLENRALARRVESLDVYLDDLNGYTFNLPPRLNEASLLKLVDEELPLTATQRFEVARWFECQRQLSSLDDLEDDEEDDEEDDDEIDDLPPVFDPGVYLGISIIACPNLKLLGVGGNIPSLEPVTCLCEAIQDVADSEEERQGPLADGFGTIEEVVFRYCHGPGGDLIASEVKPVLFYSRALKKVTIERFFARDNIGFYRDFGGSLSTVEELYIEYAGADYVDDLVSLLELCPRLKLFSLKWSEDVCELDSEIECRRLATSLMRCNPLLEELRLDMEGFVTADQIRDGGLGSLAGLKHLRKLAVQKFGLFGEFDDVAHSDREWSLAEMFPNSVQELVVFCEGRDFTESDRALVNAHGTERVQDIIIYNKTRDKWISKRHGREFAEDNNERQIPSLSCLLESINSPRYRKAI